MPAKGEMVWQVAVGAVACRAYDVSVDDDSVLPLGEGLLVDTGVQLVAPAQPAALAAAAANAARYEAPVLGPMHLHRTHVSLAFMHACPGMHKGCNGNFGPASLHAGVHSYTPCSSVFRRQA